MPAEAVLLTTFVPVALHKRAKAISKRHRTTMTHLVRTSLSDKLDEIEKREREEAERSQEPKRKPSTVGGLVPLDQRPGVDLPDDKPVDRLAPIFDQHARRIMEVFDRPQEVAIRQAEAFKAIRRLAPIRYREDEKIIERIENIIAEKAANTPPQEEDAPPILSLRAPPPLSAPADPAKLLALLKQITATQQPAIPADDSLAGKTFNLARVRAKSVLQDPNPEEE